MNREEKRSFLFTTAMLVLTASLAVMCGENEKDQDAVDAGTDSGTDAGSDVPFTCDVGTRDGLAGNTDGLSASSGITYSVRTPADYDPTVGYPLIMVYAPAGGTEITTETFTGLTPGAIAGGFIIAYADHHSPSSLENIERLALIPAEIAASWCVDTERIYVTGHSDGGSTTTIVTMNEDMMEYRPAAIAPSAAGVNEAYFTGFGACPTPIPVMIMHSSNDTLFVDLGLDARDYWVDCNGCDTTPAQTLPDGCLQYTGCVDDVEVLYCEGTGSHGTWPPLNDSVIDFFSLY